MGPGADLGEFVIESIAGRGGMGLVYRARQKTLDRIVALNAAAGYEYRLALETVEAPQGSTARTRLPLYMTLMARRGPMPFVTVQRLQFAIDLGVDEELDRGLVHARPQPRRIRAGRLSWHAVAGDQTDVTKYLSVGPQGIQLD